MSTKQLTVRMPEDLVERIPRHGKAATFIIDAVREKLERIRQEEIEASLQCLGEDLEENDISMWKPFQKKVWDRIDD